VPRKLRPLTSYPVTRTKILWRIAPFDPSLAYSTHMRSPRTLTVLANGSREVYRTRVERDLPGRFAVRDRTLVYETYPREQERWRRGRVAWKAALARRVAAEARAQANPAYKRFHRRLVAELGRPRRARANGRAVPAFRAPSDQRCAELIEEAKRSGASATLFLTPWGRELRVVAGPVSQLAALWDAETFGTNTGAYVLAELDDRGPFERALEALDVDAGLTIEYVGFYGRFFSLRLERRPRRTSYLDALSEAFDVGKPWLAARLRTRSLTIGDRSEWQQITREIVDPGDEVEEED
jgi:hypothetical protein